jgi:hypothetical protein
MYLRKECLPMGIQTEKSILILICCYPQTDQTPFNPTQMIICVIMASTPYFSMSFESNLNMYPSLWNYVYFTII